MTLSDFQQKRNRRARSLRSLPIEERREKAITLADELEQESARHGFITQTHYWVFVHAGLKEESQLALF